MFCTRTAWVCLLLCKEEGSSPVSLQLVRGGIGACMKCPYLCLFLDGDYVRQLPYVWYYVGVRAVFNMLVRNASPRWTICFRCLMFSLSGPCELLFLQFFCLLDLSCGEYNIISWYFMCCSVNLYVVLCVACLAVFVNCLVKQFAICVGVVVVLLLNVMEMFSVGGGALLDRPCMVFQRVCVLCM